MLISKLTSAVKAFHNDEDGLEAVQVVMIVAVAAVILIGAMAFGQEIFNWANEEFQELSTESITVGE